MNDLLLKLIGVRSVEDGRLEGDWHVNWTNLTTASGELSKPRLLLFILAAAAAAFFIWWFYKREPNYVSMRRRRILAGLRLAGVLILLLICAGPVLTLHVKSLIRGKVVVLLDTSKSMSRKDKYTRPEHKLVAAHTLGRVPLKDTDPDLVDAAAEAAIAGASRMDLMRAMFEHKEIRFLERLQKDYEVELVTFARAADMKVLEPPDRPAGTPVLHAEILADLKPDGLVTEIGGAIRGTLNRLKGQPLSAIILVTDGGNNKGEEPALVAQDAARDARIFPIGIGVPELRDVSLAYVFMESKIFVDDPAPIFVRLRQHGFANQPAELLVSNAETGEEIGRQPVSLGESSEQNETLRIRAANPGKYTYRVEVRLLNLASEDSEPSNNAKSRDVEVINQKLDVLLVEADPRWEYRYLKNSLLRDKRVNCRILLRVPDIAELAKAGSVYLKDFPSREELSKYHAIVFGNMPNDGFFTDKDIENIRRFVIEDGGGIWFIAGKNNLPDGYKDSKLELLLPVEFERMSEVTADDEQQNANTEPFMPILTPEGRSHSITRLDAGASESSEEQNAGYWEQTPKMDFYWFHKATRPKLGASALLMCGERRGRSQRDARYPLLVTSQVGRGRVLYQAYADLWRMRYPAELGPDTLERFHGHVIQYLGLPKLLGRSARAEIDTDKEEYAVGDRIKITARVMKEEEAAGAGTVTVEGTDQADRVVKFSVDLAHLPGEPGVFRGEVPAPNEGRFQLTIKGEDELAHADINVTVPQVEMETPDLKKELLDNVARNSVIKADPEAKAEYDRDPNPEKKAKVIPRMYFPDEAGKLIEDLTRAQREVHKRPVHTLWDTPLVLILFTLLLGAEWFVRKRSDLL